MFTKSSLGCTEKAKHKTVERKNRGHGELLYTRGIFSKQRWQKNGISGPSIIPTLSVGFRHSPNEHEKKTKSNPIARKDFIKILNIIVYLHE